MFSWLQNKLLPVSLTPTQPGLSAGDVQQPGSNALQTPEIATNSEYEQPARGTQTQAAGTPLLSQAQAAAASAVYRTATGRRRQQAASAIDDSGQTKRRRMIDDADQACDDVYEEDEARPAAAGSSHVDEGLGNAVSVMELQADDTAAAAAAQCSAAAVGDRDVTAARAHVVADASATAAAGNALRVETESSPCNNICDKVDWDKELGIGIKVYDGYAAAHGRKHLLTHIPGATTQQGAVVLEQLKFHYPGYLRQGKVSIIDDSQVTPGTYMYYHDKGDTAAAKARYTRVSSTLSGLQKFAEALQQIEPTGEGPIKWLILPEGIGWLGSMAWSSQQPIMECEAYGTLLKLLAALDPRRHQAILLTGSPGVGKSTLGKGPFIKWIAQQRGICVYATKKDRLLLDFTDKKPQVAEGGPTDFENVLKQAGAATWLICDDYVPDEQYENKYNTIVLASPKAKEFERFQKGGNVIKLYLPTWKIEDLLAAQTKLDYLTTEGMIAAFAIFGGIARSVLADPVNAAGYQNTLEEALDKPPNLERLLELHGSCAFAHDLPHKLLQFEVDRDTLQALCVGLASPYIVHRILDSMKQHEIRKLCSMINNIQGHPQLSNITATLFEGLVHNTLMSGAGVSDLPCRQLSDGSEVGLAFPSNLPRKWDSGRDDISSLKPVYLQPTAVSNAAWHSAVITPEYVRIIQVTVAGKHPVLTQPIVQLLERIKPPPKHVQFIFVLPECRYKSFEQQPWMRTETEVAKKLDCLLKPVQQLALQLTTKVILQLHRSCGGGAAQQAAEQAPEQAAEQAAEQAPEQAAEQSAEQAAQQAAE